MPVKIRRYRRHAQTVSEEDVKAEEAEVSQWLTAEEIEDADEEVAPSD